jgi:microcystin-dependent protein
MAQAKAITANPTVKAVLEYLNTKSSSSVPTGAICFFATTAIPTGWLLCNGSQVSRTEYAALFAAIGTKFGAGDGSTTFTLPNLDDRFIEGTTDTAKVGQYLEAGLPNIIGGHYGIEQTNNVSGCFYNGPTSVGSGSADYDNHMIMMDASRSSSAYGASETVQPRSVIFLPCLKF